MRDLLTTKETAEILGVTPRTVMNYLRGGLPCVKLGRTVRIMRADLDTWIASHRHSLLPVTRGNLEVSPIATKAGPSRR